MNKLIVIFFAVAVLLPFSLRAQNAISDDSLVPDLASDESMTMVPSGQKAFVPSFGGWFSPAFLSETRSAYSLTTSVTSLRLWGRLSLGGNSFIYVRGRETYTAVIAQDAAGMSGENNLDLDSGYVEIATARGAFCIDLGRKFFSVGTGLVVNGRGDGIDLSVKTPWVDISGFGFYTGLISKDSNPYGLSDKDLSDGAKRAFAGLSIEKSLLNQTGYVFFVLQKDYAKQDAGIKSRYDSQYYGIGAKGDLNFGLDYYAEGVYETGSDYAAIDNKKSDVSAFAFTAGLNWYPDLPRKPSFTLQYGFATGDSDRTGATAATGNQSGTDKGFIAFGTYNGGYAFRPSLSNIHVLRGGPSVVPFYGTQSVFRDMSLGARYDLYYRTSAGPVNDEVDNGDNRFVGQGVDLIYRWAPFRDLTVFVNYGLFVPGGALEPSEMVRHFVTAGVNVVF
jgi:hypothetical protein